MLACHNCNKSLQSRLSRSIASKECFEDVLIDELNSAVGRTTIEEAGFCCDSCFQLTNNALNRKIKRLEFEVESMEGQYCELTLDIFFSDCVSLKEGDIEEFRQEKQKLSEILIESEKNVCELKKEVMEHEYRTDK